MGLNYRFSTGIFTVLFPANTYHFAFKCHPFKLLSLYI